MYPHTVSLVLVIVGVILCVIDKIVSAETYQSSAILSKIVEYRLMLGAALIGLGVYVYQTEHTDMMTTDLASTTFQTDMLPLSSDM